MYVNIVGVCKGIGRDRVKVTDLYLFITIIKILSQSDTEGENGALNTLLQDIRSDIMSVKL